MLREYYDFTGQDDDSTDVGSSDGSDVFSSGLKNLIFVLFIYKGLSLGPRGI